MEIDNFILPAVYLIDSLGHKELYKLVQFATEQDKKIVEIAARSSISSLVKDRYISKTAVGYEVTLKGVDRLRSNLKLATLDSSRFEILNSQQRKHTMVKAVNF